MDWSCEFLQLSLVEDVIKLFRAPDFAGGIVTMPHKRTIIPLIDGYDDLVKILGACNIVYRGLNGTLIGSNTDWAGIYDAILAKSPDHAPGRVGLIIGAGGASRAAVYALWAKLNCKKIHLINRDDQEVAGLLEDVHRQPDLYWPDIIHVRSASQAKDLPPPHYIVSTVPDFEPITPSEVTVRNILVNCLSRDAGAKGLMLDMCYHPPMTRNLKLAIEFGHSIIQGFTVVASQFSVQWEMWTRSQIETTEVFRMVEQLVKERELPTSKLQGIAN